MVEDSSTFKPYWRKVSAPEDPISWVFFVVGLIERLHRPLAVVTSLGNDATGLRGFPLVIACQRVTAIFSDINNRAAIHAEVLLAANFYKQLESGSSFSASIDLPLLKRRVYRAERKHLPWDEDRLNQFPFITACLLQGVGFDAQTGYIYETQPEPLFTVFRDNDVKWGMVTIDISNLEAVSYGIVPLYTAEMKYISSRQEETSNPTPMRGPGAFDSGELRVAEDHRPQKAMSAAAYMAKFGHDAPPKQRPWLGYPNISQKLSEVPELEPSALDVVWPADRSDSFTFETRTDDQVQSPSISAEVSDTVPELQRELRDITATVNELQAKLCGKLLRKTSLQARDTGILLRSAFTKDRHLELVQVGRISLDALSGALENTDGPELQSVSFCIGSLRDVSSSDVVEVLCKQTALRHILFMQSPQQESDETSALLYYEIAKRPGFLQNTKITFAGAYSAALRKKNWLGPQPALPANRNPMIVHPVQQTFFLTLASIGSSFNLECIHLTDALLKPERFAAGFLLYLESIESSRDSCLARERESSLFCFSSAPSRLIEDPLNNAEISPIPSHSFANFLEPRVDDLIPGAWTVLVTSKYPRFTRYALVRPKYGVIFANGTTQLQAEDLDIVDLEGFLEIEAPEVDRSNVERRLDGVWFLDFMEELEAVQTLKAVLDKTSTAANGKSTE